jgi:hypothetical protein
VKYQKKKNRGSLSYHLAEIRVVGQPKISSS